MGCRLPARSPSDIGLFGRFLRPRAHRPGFRRRAGHVGAHVAARVCHSGCRVGRGFRSPVAEAGRPWQGKRIVKSVFGAMGLMHEPNRSNVPGLTPLRPRGTRRLFHSAGSCNLMRADFSHRPIPLPRALRVSRAEGSPHGRVAFRGSRSGHGHLASTCGSFSVAYPVAGVTPDDSA